MNLFSSARGLAFAGTALLGFSVSATRAHAATFTVTKAADTNDGACNADCSLREAVAAANAAAGADTIVFSPSLAGTTLSLGTIGDTSFGPSALRIASDITIQGPQSAPGIILTRRTTVANLRLFTVASGASLALRFLTLTGGVAQGGAGGSGGTGGGGAAGLGGAIFNQGTLSIESSTLTGNRALGGAGGNGSDIGFGGGGGGGLGGAGGAGALGQFDQSSGGGGGSVAGAGGAGGNAPGGSGGTGGTGGTVGGDGVAGFGNSQTAGGAAPGAGGGGGGAGGTNGGVGGSAGVGGGGGGGGGGNLSAGGGAGGFGGGGGGTGGGALMTGSLNGAGGFGGGSGGGSATANGGFGAGKGSVEEMGGGGGGAGLGGAIFNSGGTLTLSNATFVGNEAIGGAAGNGGATAGSGLGGGVFTRNGTTSLVHCTLSANTAAQGGGAFYGRGEGGTATMTLRSSILANSVGGTDFATSRGTGGSTPITNAFNLIETGGTGVITADPKLGALASNGGPVQTLALLTGSPAIDAGSSSLTTDARGQRRPYDVPEVANAAGGNGSDIGAFEFALNQPPTVTGVTLSPVAPTTASTLTANVTVADPDNDPITCTYVWRKNGAVLAGETAQTLDLSKAGNGDRGDSITVTVTANDGFSNSAAVTSAAVTIGNSAPLVQSVLPQNVSDLVGAKRTFTLTVSDADGTGDIKEAWLLINERLSWNAGATLIYVPSATSPTSGILYLRKGDAFPAAVQVGAGASASAVLDNGAVRVVASDVTITASGNSLSLTLPLSIGDGLVGVNRVFGRVQDKQGALDPTAVASDDGYRRFGNYTVTPQFGVGANVAPSVSALTPSALTTTLPASGVGPVQTVTFSAQDQNGTGDLESVWFVAGKSPNWTNSATFVYQTRTRRLFLRTDDGSAFLGGGQIGSAGIIENSQVRVDLAQVQVTFNADGKTLSLSLPLQAKRGLLGQNSIWLRAQDLKFVTAPGGNEQGYILRGTWNVVQGAAGTSKATSSAGGS